MPPQSQPPSFGSALAGALNNDYLIVALVSSRTQARFQSVGLPYGLGKSTLMLQLAYTIDGGGRNGREYEDAHSPVWNEVFANLFYNPSDIVRLLVPQPGKKVIPKACICWDAVQAYAGMEQNVSPVIRKLAGYLSEVRPEVKIILMSAPSINDISKPLRNLVAFELIVFERGKYEVQQIKQLKNFKNPRDDLIKLRFVEGTDRHTAFGPLPAEVQSRYDDFRAKMKIPFRRTLLKALERYENRDKELVDKSELTDPEKKKRSEIGRALVSMRWQRSNK